MEMLTFLLLSNPVLQYSNHGKNNEYLLLAKIFAQSCNNAKNANISEQEFFPIYSN